MNVVDNFTFGDSPLLLRKNSGFHATFAERKATLIDRTVLILREPSEKASLEH